MSGEAVKVVARCRPMNQREKDLKCEVGRLFLCDMLEFNLILGFIINLEYCTNRYQKKSSRIDYS